MKTRLFVIGLAVFSGMCLLTSPASAARKKKAFELYSWSQAGTSNFCYSIMPSSKEPNTVSAIKASKDKVCGGRDDLKRIMGQAIPLGSKVTWKLDEAQGFVLPQRDIVNDLKRFAETMPYTLIVPEPK
jgi:hypothetical protein